MQRFQYKEPFKTVEKLNGPYLVWIVHQPNLVNSAVKNKIRQMTF